MRVLFVHEQAGFQGGAEANVHQVATAFAERGHRVDLLYSELGEGGAGGFLDVFEEHWQSSDVGAALASPPDVVYVHKVSDLDLLRRLTASGLPLVRMVHDHDSYCQRSSRYFPWNRTICTRKAGYACALTCGVLRNRGGRIPLKLAWPGRKLAEIELCKRFHTHLVQTAYMER
ncbi:MAG: glycosyltransferase family 1 protein, partial [Verrucomicrobiales bacterium]